MPGISTRVSWALVASFCLGASSAYGLYVRAPQAVKPTVTAESAPQPPAANTQTDISIKARADRSAVLAGGDGQVQVEVTLTAAAAVADVPRQPSDVEVVLDVSGSMSGQKLDYAKRALHQLVTRIGPEDRLGLVIYASDASTVWPLQAPTGNAQRAWHRAIDALETAGGTNMSAGLDRGIAEIKRNARPGRVVRTLLLSDGHANEGDSSLPGLSQRARQIVRAENVLTTMGIGDDFNEDLMTALAEVGTGNFYYLSRVATIGRYFDAEFRAASQMVASAVELHIDTEPGAVVLDVSGYPLEHAGERTKVQPGNLFAGQKRTLWVTLQLPTTRTGPVGLGRFSLAYKRATQPFLATTEPLPAIACVEDQASFERGIDRGVWEAAVTNQQLSKTRLELGKAIADGNAADVDRVVTSYETNRKLADKLGSKVVLDSLAGIEQEASDAKRAQAAPAAERQYNAKQKKARAVFDLRSDAYHEDPKAGL